MNGFLSLFYDLVLMNAEPGPSTPHAIWTCGRRLQPGLGDIRGPSALLRFYISGLDKDSERLDSIHFESSRSWQHRSGR